MNRWDARALVLVVETRLCTRCGTRHETPGTLQIRLTSGTRSWYIPHKEPLVTSFLRRERLEVETTLQACTRCFNTTPIDQLELFPQLFQPQLAYAARVRAYERAKLAELQGLSSSLPSSPRTSPRKVKKPLTLAEV